MIGKRIEWARFGSKHMMMTGTVMDCNWSPQDGGGEWELLVALDSGEFASVSAIGESAKIIEDAPQKVGSLRDELINILTRPGVASVDISLAGRLLGIEVEKATWSEVYCAMMELGNQDSGLFNELYQAHSRIAELEVKLKTNEASS